MIFFYTAGESDTVTNEQLCVCRNYSCEGHFSDYLNATMLTSTKEWSKCSSESFSLRTAVKWRNVENQLFAQNISVASNDDLPEPAGFFCLFL